MWHLVRAGISARLSAMAEERRLRRLRADPEVLVVDRGCRIVVPHKFVYRHVVIVDGSVEYADPSNIRIEDGMVSMIWEATCP